MTKTERHIYRHLHKYRRTIQRLALVFIIVIPILNKQDWNCIIGTFYSLSIGNLDIIDPALIIQFLLLTKSITIPVLLAGAIPFITALFLGKVFCSWMCPFNLFAEWTENLCRRIKKEKLTTPHRNPKAYYYWLIFTVILALIAITDLSLINFISMPGLISSLPADWMVGGSIGIEALLIIIILVVELGVAPRFWCKYVCPVGATLELPRNKRTLKIHFTPQQKCVCDAQHPACNIECPIHLDPRRTDIHPYCYNCGECVRKCLEVGGDNLLFSMQEHKTKLSRQTQKVNSEV